MYLAPEKAGDYIYLELEREFTPGSVVFLQAYLSLYQKAEPKWQCWLAAALFTRNRLASEVSEMLAETRCVDKKRGSDFHVIPSSDLVPSSLVIDTGEAAQSALVSMTARDREQIEVQLCSDNIAFSSSSFEADISLPSSSTALGVAGGSSAASDTDTYDAFIASLVNDWDESFAEGADSTISMKAELGNLTQGDFVAVDFLDASALLGLYLEACHPLAGNNPVWNLESMHPHYYNRQSRRIRAQQAAKQAAIKRTRSIAESIVDALPPKHAKNRPNAVSERLDKWMTGGVLISQHREWSVLPTPDPELLLDPSKIHVQPAHAFITGDSMHTSDSDSESDNGTDPKPKSALPKSKTRCGRRPPTHQFHRLLQRLEIIVSGDFDFKWNSLFSSMGWNGIQPPLLACEEIQRLFRLYPDARGLYEYIQSVKSDRATFLVDRNGQIFFFRSFQAEWLMAKSRTVTVAINVLVGDDATDPQVKIDNANSKPTLADSHKHSEHRVKTFMNLEIVQRIISWVSSVVEIVFPGVAQRFRAETAIHVAKRLNLINGD
ncbi:hypothetical protein R3P38DRAFT_2808675 [Favolaschia claudopus]|uniref:RGS domain-containing protein n=1 Tax=Favolaschia claudopus TaxID=2862362 RepID=A0AAV9ZF18_9AGAR